MIYLQSVGHDYIRNLRVSDLQANARLAEKGEHQTRMAKDPYSIFTGGNIFVAAIFGLHLIKPLMLNDGFGCYLLSFQWIILHEPTALNKRFLLLRAGVHEGQSTIVYTHHDGEFTVE